ncbi:glycosyltransferase [Candidatus Nephthysia bennettiae]|uniref:Glycosyltransferase n=1 Tax=Candidatus Nephthysia bennettiae TaxID=3127016 RepID=A0A934KBJ1_9BACT|nr:glycosyltransferase [Candidatus Dormibacteraeota bacterium]MBJ7610887.1 glycosyltransferase [Candidatus Dormibacteraeota bacterium]
MKSRRTRSSKQLEEDGGPAPDTKLKASICIPSYNRKELLLATLRSLNQQSAPPDTYEVIVADDGSSDGTVEALADLRTRYRLRWFTQPNAGPAAASNAAAEMAENEVLIFLDADQVCSLEMVAVHLETHEREGNVFVQGLYPLAEGYRSRAASLLYERELLSALEPIDRPHPASPHMWSAQVSVRRSVWKEVGGFDSSFREYGGEDTDFGLRVAAMGIRFLFDPRALSYHLHDVSYGSLRKQAYHEGCSIVRLSKKHGLSVETLFGGELDKRVDRLFESGWNGAPRAMDAIGHALSWGVMAADAVRARPLQLLAARLVHRWYKVGGLVAAGYRPGTAKSPPGPA